MTILQANRIQQGTPLVFIHPITGVARGATYKTIVMSLFQQYPIYCIDYPTKRHPNSQVYTMDTLCDLYQQHIESIGTEVVLIGWSFGGNIIPTLLSKLEPSLVVGAIIIDSINSNMSEESTQELTDEVKKVFNLILDAFQISCDLNYETTGELSHMEYLETMYQRLTDCDLDDGYKMYLYNTLKNYMALLTMNTEVTPSGNVPIVVLESAENRNKLGTAWNHLSPQIIPIVNTSHMDIVDSMDLPDVITQQLIKWNVDL
jgi:thioesterase domain-containing protein